LNAAPLAGEDSGQSNLHLTAFAAIFVLSWRVTARVGHLGNPERNKSAIGFGSERFARRQMDCDNKISKLASASRTWQVSELAAAWVIRSFISPWGGEGWWGILV
jgi:hypothetical protein